jgi:hypothetical protein
LGVDPVGFDLAINLLQEKELVAGYPTFNVGIVVRRQLTPHLSEHIINRRRE